MSTPAIAVIDQTSVGSRAIVLLRRVLARSIDGVLLAIPIGLIVGVGMFTTVAAAVGTGAAIGGDGGLLAGAGVAVLLQVLLLFGGLFLTVLIPLLYFRWAARRPGAEQGQTVGRQLLGLTLARTSSQRPVRGRTMLLREFAIIVWLFPVALGGGIVGGVAESPSLGTSAQLLLLGGVLWLSRDGRLPHDRMTTTRIGDDWAASER